MIIALNIYYAIFIFDVMSFYCVIISHSAKVEWDPFLKIVSMHIASKCFNSCFCSVYQFIQQ